MKIKDIICEHDAQQILKAKQAYIDSIIKKINDGRIIVPSYMKNIQIAYGIDFEIPNNIDNVKKIEFELGWRIKVHFSVKVINDKLTSVIIPENFHEELSSWLKTVFGLTELTDLKLETDKDAILLNALNDELYFESKQVGNKLRKDLGVLAPILLDYKYTVAQRKMVVAAINQKKSTHENILEHSLPQLEYAKDIYRQQLKKKIENGQLILPAWWDFAIMGSGYIELKPHLLKNKSSNKIPHQLIDFLTTEKIRTVHISSFQNMDTGFIFLEGPAYNTQNYDLYGDKWLNQAKILLNMVFKVNFSDLEIYKSYMYELAFSSEQLGKYINRQLGPLKSLFYSKDKNDQAFKIDLKALII